MMTQSADSAVSTLKPGKLAPEDILAAYDVVCKLYPHLPSLLLWRAWEFAAYQRFKLEEPVLDIGCGNGKYFQLVWPDIHTVTGVDIDFETARAAMLSGVYKEVYRTPAHTLPTPNEHFGSAFANCSLEHMDHIDGVLSEICRSLQPGAPFVLSVVTDKFIEWATLPLVASRISEAGNAKKLQDQYEAYHHLTNPFTVEKWIDSLETAGFEVVEHIPILPEITSRAFSFIDQLWHVEHGSNEVGTEIYSHISKIPSFPQGFRQILAGVLDMEQDWFQGSGAVFMARKRIHGNHAAFLPVSNTSDAYHKETVHITMTTAESLVPTNATCWCGNTSLAPFSPHYLRCPVCETLVTAEMPAPEFTAVHNDEQDFYGREYWFSHQEEDLGQANIVERARTDMPERALHWLRTLLKYKLPPGDVLELGSAHGGFVALLRWAGFEASGLELSPSIVEYAKQTFGVPMLLGPVEEQNIAPGSLDAIALMDVLEHLPDPIGTMRHSLSLLKPDGILLIQTPRYAEGKTFAAMEAERDPFLIQLKHEQHLYLFSHTSARELFQRLGAEHVAFEPAIFGHYDMFIVVSRAPLAETNSHERESPLLATANNRMVQALLDLDDARLRVGTQLQEADRDRDARLAVIERQGAELGRIPALEADVEFLKNQLIASEADRAARLAVIERQGAELGQVQHRLGAAERQLAEVRGLIADIRRLAGTHKREIALRALNPRTWRRVRGKVKQLLAIHAISQSAAPATTMSTNSNQLADYVAKIDQFNAGQPNAQLLNAIRAYNHQMVDTLHGIVPLAGKRLLDIGASPHGYALERALTHQVAEYVGIGLDVEQPLTIRAAQGSGTLLYMDATKLDMPDNSFDLVISMSTFEHIGDVATALAEIRRVLKPGGKALLSYEPIWTCSYGHHLHHFGPIARHMPDWGQLVWDKAAMLRELADVWPKDGVPSLEEAAAWVYDSPALNRIGMQQMLQLLRESGLAIEWLTKIPDESRSAARLKEIEQATGLSREDLIAKGLSVFLAKI